jgi:glycoside/pentoside/hexuronide:cation symporter, GPH family
MSNAASAPLRRAILLAYASPALVVALPTIPVYLHLPTLYGVEMGLGLAATGAFLLLARLFDTVTDPLIGYVSDRFPLRGLRRKPWILMGAGLAGWGLVRLLGPPPDANGVYLLTWSLVLYAGWTMVTVPYMAWGAELHPDYNERARITGWREGLALLGMLGASGLAAYVTETADAAAAPRTVAWTAVGLGLIFIPILLWFVPERTSASTVENPLRLKKLKSLLGNALFLRLLSAWFVNGLANGIPAALFFLYLEHGLGVAEVVRPRFILVYFVAAIAAIPLWLRLSRNTSKHRTWCWAMILACAAFAIVPTLPAGAEAAFMLICILTGAALGADLVLPPAIQADVADYDRWRFGADRTGVQFALWGMATKLALAAAVGLALPGVAWMGFDPELPSEAGRSALIVIYAGIPVVIKLMAIVAIWNFPLSAVRHTAISRRLKQRLTLSSSGEHE